LRGGGKSSIKPLKTTNIKINLGGQRWKKKGLFWFEREKTRLWCKQTLWKVDTSGSKPEYENGKKAHNKGHIKSFKSVAGPDWGGTGGDQRSLVMGKKGIVILAAGAGWGGGAR